MKEMLAGLTNSVSQKHQERTQPTQARSRKTVNKILDAAAELLDESGLAGFNTNVLAERAEIRIRTIYRYYPSKIAVIAALWQQMVSEWDQWLAEGMEAIADPKQDPVAAWLDMAEQYIDWMSKRKGALAVRRTIRAVPELHALEWETDDYFTKQLSKALRIRGVNKPASRRRIFSKQMLETANVVIHSELIRHGGVRRDVRKELYRMQELYMLDFLQD